jgi:hypothetical protein
VDDKYYEERLAREDQTWTGPRFVGLLFVTLGLAFALIYFISSVGTGDYTWHPLANDPVREAPISDWGPGSN